MPNHSSVTFREALPVWLKIAALSFGGPAGQISVMHRILVEEKKWMSNEKFLHALNYCMMLPGPEAQQLAIYSGWLLHGIKGGLTAGLLFILPGFIAILALSLIYALYDSTTAVTALFFGLKAAVLAIVLEALRRISKKALKSTFLSVIAALAFTAIFFFNAPFPAIIVTAAIIGLVFSGRSSQTATPKSAIEEYKKPKWKSSLAVLAVGATLWFGPLLLLFLFTGPHSVFSNIGIFFSKLAVVTFGGAYAVLSYVAQEAVQTYQWLEPGEMIDGLGMAETTPGPLIMVVQFVGFMGALRAESGPFHPLVMGTLGAIAATWFTFVPCFIWIFLGAPYVERLRGKTRLNGAMSAITAAVVGVILNLALWFGMHVLFSETGFFVRFGLNLEIPVLKTLDPLALVMVLLALGLSLVLKRGVFTVLLVTTTAGFLAEGLRQMSY